ncbi:hypothetical protein [Paraburkholderia sp.]|nr:hypothetical protein [Paraburkholderia sp.]MDE1180357.1 hypothetical protein [Paraburkholderia sp.]
MNVTSAMSNAASDDDIKHDAPREPVQPQKPSQKDLPELPDPTEVGEDG